MKGEGVDDHGGPYSQLFTDICLELQRINEDGTPFLPLFVPSPNNVSGQGLNQEKFVINPILPPEDTHLRLDYYRFFGKLMGMAIRTNIPLPLDLPSLFWKRLVNDPVNLSDLEEIDHATTKLIKELKSLSQESFEARYSDNPLYFMVQLGNDEVYDLIQHGRHVTVNYKNLTEFIDKLSQFHLTTSIERQLSAIVSGLETIIPVDCLNVFTPQELQIVVCGSPEINIAMLKERAIYEDVNPSEPHIDYFWQVLEEFDTEKRCQFLQFVWARTRIPASGLSMNLKIQRSRKDFPDHFLPTTQTCFFSISLPTYSSIEVTRKQLLYAITHCADMDNDILLH
uniref:HECT domain-containing protein n=1 Tax=Arcella intermedia TaxID=1963864 RepID=A0A6B2L8M4_9EUKA